MKKEICQICGRKLRPTTREHACNITIIGTNITNRGHPVCVDNVDNLVVIPNRCRVEVLALDQKKKEF
jgi:hypothetical protein